MTTPPNPPNPATPPSPAPEPDTDDTPFARAIIAALKTGNTALAPDGISVSAKEQATLDDVVAWLRALAQPDDAPMDPASAASKQTNDFADDPIAVALGLVIDPTRRVSADRLRRARLAAGLKSSEIVNRLSRRGWSITTAEVFKWERHDTALSPALSADLARILRVGLHDLALVGARRPEWHGLRGDPAIEHALLECAANAQVSIDELTHRLDDVLAGAVHRNRTKVDRTAFLAFLYFVRDHPHLLRAQ